MSFTGFPVAALDFYDDLEIDNTKSFWEAHRSIYAESVQAPMRALCAELTDEFGPAKVYRPYRDVRFAKDKTPYKTHQGAFFAAGPSTGLYVQISAAGTRVGGGFYDAGGPRLAAIREAIDDDKRGQALEKLLDALDSSGWEIGGSELKTAPRGYDRDHPRIHLLRRKQLVAGRAYGFEEDAIGATLVDRVRQDWRALKPLVEWLNALSEEAPVGEPIPLREGMADDVTLRDGTKAVVWPLLTTDRERLAEEFQQLSSETRRHRFLAPMAELSEPMLRQLVDGVDGINHVALVLLVEHPEGDFDPVGLARMVRYDDLPDTADLAVTVRDDWQGRGVATALLEVLVRRRPPGVTHVLTEVAGDNPASLAMLNRLGPMQMKDHGYGPFDVEVDLLGAGPHVVDDPAKTRLHPVLAGDWRDELRWRDRVCPWVAPHHSAD